MAIRRSIGNGLGPSKWLDACNGWIHVNITVIGPLDISIEYILHTGEMGTQMSTSGAGTAGMVCHSDFKTRCTHHCTAPVNFRCQHEVYEPLNWSLDHQY